MEMGHFGLWRAAHFALFRACGCAQAALSFSTGPAQVSRLDVRRSLVRAVAARGGAVSAKYLDEEICEHSGSVSNWALTQMAAGQGFGNGRRG